MCEQGEQVRISGSVCTDCIQAMVTMENSDIRTYVNHVKQDLQVLDLVDTVLKTSLLGSPHGNSNGLTVDLVAVLHHRRGECVSWASECGAYFGNIRKFGFVLICDSSMFEHEYSSTSTTAHRPVRDNRSHSCHLACETG